MKVVMNFPLHFIIFSQVSILQGPQMHVYHVYPTVLKLVLVELLLVKSGAPFQLYFITLLCLMPF
jgi:hypothetical protein